MVFEKITDPGIAYIEMNREQFHALPEKVQTLLKTYGTERLQGWGKPIIISIARYRIAELEKAMQEG